MAKNPHVRLNTAVQVDPSFTFKFNYGGGKKDEEEEKNYTPMAEQLQQAAQRYEGDSNIRERERSPELKHLDHIDFIRIEFQGQFDSSNHLQNWFNKYGLQIVDFQEFNRVGIFEATDQDKIQYFLTNVERFVEHHLGIDEYASYSGEILFVRDFALITTSDRIKYDAVNHAPITNLSFASSQFSGDLGEVMLHEFITYLEERAIEYSIIETSNLIELYEADYDTIIEVAQNFDIILSSTNSLVSIVQPTEFGTAERTFGFEIANADDEDLPLVGIIDSGVSMASAIAPIVLEQGYDLTGSSAHTDSAGEEGHGTAVAALAALGDKMYSGEAGPLQADARVLPIKVINDAHGYVSILALLDTLRMAKKDHPAIKIFVLTICFDAGKETNESYSAYAYELDRFSHEHDCLIFISAGNNNHAVDELREYDLNYFNGDHTRINVPAESMNNLTVGAAADNLRSEGFYGISPMPEYPAAYTRTCHIDLSRYATVGKRFTKDNKNLVKPDLIIAGGDYESYSGMVGAGEKATMELLHANPALGSWYQCGTSFSAPLAANLALQIQKQYPELRAQSIKALLVNSAEEINKKESEANKRTLWKAAGRGILNPYFSVGSDDDAVTFVIEDEIMPGDVKVIPVNFPSYLLDVDKKTGLLKITGTLCFSFLPVRNNQLAYCPVQMAFRIVRNHTPEQIIAPDIGKNGINSNLRLSWSQNNRYKGRPIPASNCQKTDSFLVGFKELDSENRIFKIAVHCLLNSQLFAGQEKAYNQPVPFSLALRVEENLKREKRTSRLYQEMLACNEVEAITRVDNLGATID